MDRITNMRKTCKRNILKSGFYLASLLLIMAMFFYMKNFVKAAENSIIVSEINYQNSTLTLQTNKGDTAFYFLNPSNKKWKAIQGQVNNGKIAMDISWISDSSNYSLSFKGNISTDVIKVTIPKKETRFKASFSTLKGTVIFSNTGSRLIEWRKKNSTVWHTVNMDTLSSELSCYFTNGAQICYRLAPVNGTGISNPGLRASNEVTVTIPKKAAAPKVAVNGSRFSIAVRKGMSYRKVNDDGTVSDWINITGNTDLMLSVIAPEVLYIPGTGAYKSAVFQFRINAGNTNQVSNITTLTIPVQKSAPDINSCGITLNYNSSSTLSLAVKTAASSNPFEYTIIPKDKELNYQTASWKPVNSSSEVSIDSKSAPAGSHIYVRRKSVEASEGVSFSLASQEIEITGINGTEYPRAVQATQLTTLVTAAGVCRTDISSSYLTFYLYSPTAATVSAIDFYNINGSRKGSVSCSSTVARNTRSSGADDKYIISTKITSTADIDEFTEEELYGQITLSNNEIIKSTSSTGVMLYLYQGTVVNNPAQSGYSDDFRRIYMSKDTGDASSFKFRLKFGTEKVPDASGINKFTQEATSVSQLKYNGYILQKDSDYTVTYTSNVNEDNITEVEATITVDVSRMEKAAYIKLDNQAVPIIISLNNGEILDNCVFITMVGTALIDDTPIAWSVTEGSLTESTTSTVTNPDGSTTTKTQEVITFTINLTLFNETYDVGVSNVTWGGISILSSATVSKGKATIYLSNAKINKLRTEASDTKNLVITLSNGYVIDTGCKLTIINGD